MRLAAKRILQLYKNGGMREVHRGISDHLENKNKEYRLSRNDNRDRWEFISANLSDDDESLLDIGCAEGYFVLNAADLGISATGYDLNYTRVEKAKERAANNPNASFKLARLTPEDIRELPDTDVILFLTVHHHWESQFGIGTAGELFSELLAKSNKLFYEPPGHLKVMTGESPKELLEVDDPQEYYHEQLMERFGPDIEILDATVIDYADDTDRRDPLFFIDSSNFSIK